MKVHKSSDELQKEIDDLKNKNEAYKVLIKDLKGHIFKIGLLEGEIVKKDNLIKGMEKVIADLSSK